jgi:hypothetical protein
VLQGWTPAERQAGRRVVQLFIEGGRDGRWTIIWRIIPAPGFVLPMDMNSLVSCITLPGGGHLITWLDLVRLTRLLYGYIPGTEERNELRERLQIFQARSIGKHDALTAHLVGYTAPPAAATRLSCDILPWVHLEEILEAIAAKRVMEVPKTPRVRL